MFKYIPPVWKPDRSTASLFLYLCAAGLLVTGLFSMTGARSSPTRLAMLGLAILFCVGLCALGWQLQKLIGLLTGLKNFASTKTQIVLIAIAVLVFMTCWSLLWTPLENFGGYYYYFLAAYPFIIWLACASAGSLILLLASHYGLNIHQWKENIQNQRIALIIAGGILFIFTLLAWAASFRVVGAQAIDEDFWYGAGVPVLAFQVLASIIIGLGLSVLVNKWIRHNSAHSIHVNLLLFLLIWAVSAWLWAKEPVKPDFLITQPAAPNFEMYPDYDARNYDVMSQFATIGQGINNYRFFDRVLYPAFLTYLHTFAGQDYSHLMAIQASIFAVLPALLFLIGTYICNRAGGLVLGILAALRGINHINIGNIIDTAHQKQMLTEYPTAILLVLATFFLVKWAQNPNKNWPLAGLTGAIIGMSTLLRPHTLVIIPLFFVLAFFVYQHRIRIWLGIGTLFLIAAIFSVIPWVQFGGQNVSIFALYIIRIEDVIRQRYPQLIAPQGRQIRPSTENTQATLQKALYSPEPPLNKSVLAFTADNFLNNLVTSVQSLPSTPYNLEPRAVIKKTENFWKPYWDGNLTFWARILIPLNLLVLALGLGTAWKRARLSGLIPLIIMLSYFMINSLGRTSGGRYLVPVDWVVLIYYVLGLTTIVELLLSFFMKINEPAKDLYEVSFGLTPWWISALTVLVISLAIGSLIPLAQKINPLRFQVQTPLEQADTFLMIAGNRLNLSAEKLQSFLSSENAVIVTGRSLYPRQMKKDEGLDVSVYKFYHSMPFPRTLITVLGQNGEMVMILPRIEPAIIPNSTDVMVIGCIADEFVSAWAVIRLDDNSVYERTPSNAPLACPLPEPVCDNNKSCH